MSKVLIIYNSKTGFTERYARWLAEAIPCTLVAYDQRQSVNLADYSAVVFGGWCHAGTVMGLKWFQKKLPELAGKATAVFAVGATPAGTPEAEEAMKHCLTAQEKETTPIFYLSGGLNYEKMGTGDRVMMAVFRKLIKKTKGEDSEMFKMLCTSYDISSKDALQPIVNFLNERA